MPAVTGVAALSLEFLVIGGGVGGLAVAYVLSKAGHRVRVLERCDLNVPGGGHRIPPNLSKIFRQWVGEKELVKVSTRCVGTPFHHLRTGDVVGHLHWQPVVMNETGGDFILMHHEDIVRMLYKLATEAGAVVDLNAEIITIQQGSDKIPNPSVTLANGEVLTADILIGADGYTSLTRKVVLKKEDNAKPAGMTLYTGVVNAENMLKDPELRPYAITEGWPIFMGHHRSVCGHPVRAMKEFSFHIYSWHDLDGSEPGAKESWDELFPTQKMNMETYGHKVQRLIQMAPYLIRTQFMFRTGGIDDWADATRRIVLLGDAAHPSLPGGFYGSSMAVEDAVVFGTLFAHLSMMDQIPTFLSAYQELRQRRCDLMKLADIGNAQMVSMPDGPHAEARDEDMRRWDENTLQDKFEEIADIFLNDPWDAAEEWWVNWGRFSHTAREQPPAVNFDDIDFSSITVHDN